MHPRYSEWIEYVFNHPVTEVQWYFELGHPTFEASESDYAELLRETFERASVDLIPFSDAQANQGLWFLASPSGSNFLFALRDGNIPTSQKVAGIRSIYDLYRDCFAKRCTETLCHLDEPDSSELNGICYMFWDVCPLTYLEETRDRAELEDAVFSVLEATLTIPHRACIEAALHGLGEITYEYEDRVTLIIDDFLRTTRIDDALRAYAERAKRGDVL